VKYGTEFNLETLTDAVERYEKLKSAGMPQYLLGQQMQVIDNLYARSNYEYEKKVALLRLIEPLRNVPLSNINQDSLDYTIKSRFLELIDEFEMRNGSITHWGELLPIETRVQRIKQTIKQYAKQAITDGEYNTDRQEGDSVPVIPQGRQPVSRIES
jgi:hypothetical protein